MPQTNIFEMLREPYRLPKRPKLFEAFAGVGCQHMAFNRLGIDDNDYNKASQACSNSQLYKQAGNGIVVDVFAAILKQMMEN